MMMIFFIHFFWLSAAQASLKLSFNELLKNEISKNYRGAEIRLSGPVRWVRGLKNIGISQHQEVSIFGDDGHGNIRFLVKSGNVDSAEGWVSFSAWVQAKVPIQRIFPGQPLHDDQFTIQTVEVSKGLARDYRGILMSTQLDLNGYEATQTLLEGSFLTSAAVQRIPDIHRGDWVQIHLITPGIVLTTSGHSEETGYLLSRIRVITEKGKKELSGLLRPGSVVEVNL